MGRFLSYRSAVLFGFYYYLVFQFIYLLRFGSLNFSVGLLDIVLPVIGTFSVLFLVFFAKKLPARQELLLVPFFLALPFSIIGSLLGGLLGPIGTIFLGLLPFAITLALGYWLIKRLLAAPTVDPGIPLGPSSAV
jgi:hypothetical protein